MNKFFILWALLPCTLSYAVQSGLDSEFLKQSNRISDEQKTLYAKVDELGNIKFERDLTETETVQYNKAVCATLAAESKLTQFWLSNIEQTRFLLEDETLDADKITKIMQDSVSYDAAQELKGTPAECK